MASREEPITCTELVKGSNALPLAQWMIWYLRLRSIGVEVSIGTRTGRR